MSEQTADDIHRGNYDRGMHHVHQAESILVLAENARLDRELIALAMVHATLANALFNAQITPR